MATKTSTPAESAEPKARISRDDLERNFRAVQQGIQGRVDEKKPTMLMIGAAGGVVLLLLFFVLGRRSGKKKTTLVEIRRF
jgi:hypothetical protein